MECKSRKLDGDSLRSSMIRVSESTGASRAPS